MLMLLSGCSLLPNTKSPNGISKYGSYFDTYVSITLYGLSDKEAEPILESCFEMFDNYEALLSADISDSDIYNINNSNGEAVKVNPETLDLIMTANKYSDETDGLFDISVYGILSYYDFHANSEKIPSNSEISEAIKHVSYKNIYVNQLNNTVTLSDPKTVIEIGGIAKGYIADKVADYLRNCKVTGAIINIGGDLSTIGTKADGSKFCIGISDPQDENNTLCGVFLANKSVATSGTYIRSFYKDGVFYHHIIDPRTGFPAKTDIVSATVISDSATDCDTLCTILILLGSRDALSYIESIPATETILVTEDGKLLKSSGADNYIKQ